ADRARARRTRARGARSPDTFRWFSPSPAIRRRPASKDVLTHTRKGGVAGFHSSSGLEADPAAGVAVEPPGEVELEQGHLYGAARCPGQTDDLVDRHRRRAEQGFDRIERVVAVELFGRLVGGLRSANAARRQADRLDHVGGILDQGGAVADQLIAAL